MPRRRDWWLRGGGSGRVHQGQRHQQAGRVLHRRPHGAARPPHGPRRCHHLRWAASPPPSHGHVFFVERPCFERMCSCHSPGPPPPPVLRGPRCARFDSHALCAVQAARVPPRTRSRRSSRRASRSPTPLPRCGTVLRLVIARPASAKRLAWQRPFSQPRRPALVPRGQVSRKRVRVELQRELWPCGQVFLRRPPRPPSEAPGVPGCLCPAADGRHDEACDAGARPAVSRQLQRRPLARRCSPNRSEWVGSTHLACDSTPAACLPAVPTTSHLTGTPQLPLKPPTPYHHRPAPA